MDQLVLLGTLAVIGIAVFLAMCRWPRFGAVTWVLVICFVPVWFGVVYHGLFQAHMVVGFLVVVSWLLRVRHVKATAVDVILLVVLLIVAVEYVLHLTTLSFAFTMFVQWAGAYLVGRLITHVVPTHWVYGLIGVAFTAVGALAIIEFATSTNLFIELLPSSNPLFQTWGTLQPRGAIIRAEGAFGHSIALGTSLGIATGLTLVSRVRPWLRVVMICVMLGGAVVSFSRAGMLTAVLAIALVAILGRRESSLSPRVRAAVITAVVIGSSAAAGFVLQVFSDSENAQGSADYRADLLTLIGSIHPLGLSSAFEKSTASVASIGAFGSIDNAALLFGLSYGWIPLVLAGACWLGALVVSFMRKATAPTLTFVALTPAFVTVAFITQYAALVWFLAGLAVATQAARRSPEDQVSRAQVRRARANP